MPDQPVQDGGRPVRAPARGAREPPAPLREPAATSARLAAARGTPGDPRGRLAPRPRGRLVVVTGPSGAGKGTLIRRLASRRADVEVAVSATTRRRRAGEEDGRDYHFLSEEEFARRVEAGEFLEHVRYVSGHRYGTLLSEVERILGGGRCCILELETAGARRVKELLPDTVTIFVAPPSLAELERRLRERATESAGEIGERLELARRQAEEAGDFDVVVVNDELERAVGELDAILARAQTE